LIGTRSARLSACGVAAIATKKALREILDWPAKKNSKDPDPIEILPAEDGSGVGAALIAALTLKRAKEGNMAGIQHPENYK
jgi:hexokinase